MSGDDQTVLALPDFARQALKRQKTRTRLLWRLIPASVTVAAEERDDLRKKDDLRVRTHRLLGAATETLQLTLLNATVLIGPNTLLYTVTRHVR